mmetsp:Transcript_21497/g.49535  ORF Transcript_21497/g.49535 Transcript_21497/m.49535 type:complete len:209 (-) Transcript_21497:807-1433(-)
MSAASSSASSPAPRSKARAYGLRRRPRPPSKLLLPPILPTLLHSRVGILCQLRQVCVDLLLILGLPVLNHLRRLLCFFLLLPHRLLLLSLRPLRRFRLLLFLRRVPVLRRPLPLFDSLHPRVGLPLHRRRHRAQVRGALARLPPHQVVVIVKTTHTLGVGRAPPSPASPGFLIERGGVGPQAVLPVRGPLRHGPGFRRPPQRLLNGGL